ncbi:MAG: hypothetical protein CM15mP53_04750 [Ectothiorhodospiraceae bacterium]|nr:MAG: hypothetical protein CM15mP53_04750 [Ectothiorhodospiraceae bacterium]
MIKYIYLGVACGLLFLLNADVALASDGQISNANTAWILTSTALVLITLQICLFLDSM